MSIINSVRDYIMKFPQLKDGYLLVDFLNNEAVAYDIEPVPSTPIYKQYTDGSSIKQLIFIFASRETYSADVNQCIENLSFYENFENWIYNNNENGIYPILDSGKQSISIEVLTSGYAFSAESNTARYQVQLRLLYEEV